MNCRRRSLTQTWLLHLWILAVVSVAMCFERCADAAEQEASEDSTKQTASESSTGRQPESQGLLWAFGGGLFHRGDPLPNSSGTFGMGLGIRGPAGIVGVEAAVNDRAFFENKPIEPQNIPAIDEFIRSNPTYS